MDMAVEYTETVVLGRNYAESALWLAGYVGERRKIGRKPRRTHLGFQKRQRTTGEAW
jgi:hypothetical protein